MKGEKLVFLHPFQSLPEESDIFVHYLFFVVDPGHDDRAQPKPLFALQAVIEKFERALDPSADKFFIALFIGHLYVENDQLARVHSRPNTLRNLDGARGVERAAYAESGEFSLAFENKFGINERLPAAESDSAAALEISLVTPDLGDEFVRLDGRPARKRARVGIVTIYAVERAALEEHGIAYARPVQGRKALFRMQRRFHRLEWKVRLMTSCCCSRLSLLKLTAYPLTLMVRLG